MLRPIAGSSGFQEVYTNIGEMENKGWEIELGLHPISKKNFKWDIEANFTANKNKVTKLAEGVDEIDIETAFASIGSTPLSGLTLRRLVFHPLGPYRQRSVADPGRTASAPRSASRQRGKPYPDLDGRYPQCF